MKSRIDLELELKIWEEIKLGKLSNKEISKKYGVSSPTVTNIRIRQSKGDTKTRRLTTEERNIIINDIKNNKLRRTEVSTKYNISIYSAAYYINKANNIDTNTPVRKKTIFDRDDIIFIINDIKSGIIPTYKISQKYKLTRSRLYELKNQIIKNSFMNTIQKANAINQMIKEGYSNEVIKEVVSVDSQRVSYYRRKIAI